MKACGRKRGVLSLATSPTGHESLAAISGAHRASCDSWLVAGAALARLVLLRAWGRGEADAGTRACYPTHPGRAAVSTQVVLESGPGGPSVGAWVAILAVVQRTYEAYTFRAAASTTASKRRR
jgi:hypothetical protein